MVFYTAVAEMWVINARSSNQVSRNDDTTLNNSSLTWRQPMNKITSAILTASALALTSVSAFAASDEEKIEEKIEEECHSAAMEEKVPAKDMESYIADCIAETLAGEKEDQSEDYK